MLRKPSCGQRAANLGDLRREAPGEGFPAAADADQEEPVLGVLGLDDLVGHARDRPVDLVGRHQHASPRHRGLHRTDLRRPRPASPSDDRVQRWRGVTGAGSRTPSCRCRARGPSPSRSFASATAVERPTCTDRCLAAHRPGVFRDAADEAHLHVGRRVTDALRQRRVDRAAHRRVEQRQREAAVHDADRVVVLFAGIAFEHDAAFVDLGDGEVHQPRDRRRRQRDRRARRGSPRGRTCRAARPRTRADPPR